MCYLGCMRSRSNPKLAPYRDKRVAGSTPEPFGRMQIPATGATFVVQQHAASHLHFDLRLEVDGVLKSWAVPKGPSDDPADKRFAVATEDHPLDYADFEGVIPPGNYGAGQVIVWDRGRYQLKGEFAQGLLKGKLLFELQGYKLRGKWTLVKMKTRSSKDNEWLLIKEYDNYVSDNGPTFDDTSVLSGLTVAQLAKPAPKLAAFQRRLGKLEQAVDRSKPPSPKPMLASAAEPHNRKGWLWELKYDGYRALAQKHEDQIKLWSRNGNDLSQRFPEICQVLTHLPYDSFLMDGELVITDASGRPNFDRMQQRGSANSLPLIARAAILEPATYFAFDLLYAAGHDLRACTLRDRKTVLQAMLPAASAVVFSAHIEDQGQATFESARDMGLEGVVGKRADSPYRAGRAQDWLKVRHQRSGDYVVVGWTPAKSNAADIGSLALAEWRDEVLTYCGHVGSGLNQKVRGTLNEKFKRMARKTSALQDTSAITKLTHWLRPNMVIEAAYSEYSAHGHLRHPVFLRLRTDKLASECTSAYLDTQAQAPSHRVQVLANEVPITNPDKVLFPEKGWTKQQLVDYYKSIAPWMLPYLTNRPVVLTRYPDGIHGKSFFQHNVPDYVPDWLQRETLWSESNEKEVSYFIPQREADLAYLANLATLPIHIWHSTLDDLEHPDWCVLDLDPKQAPFKDVIKLALAIGELADELALPAFAKTSGASGIHVLLPLDRQLTHQQAQTLGELLATVLVQRYGDIATIERSVRARGQKVYVDYLQNGHGRLIVAPFAVRAEAAASVSMPVHWHELNNRLKIAQHHIGNGVRRMRRLDDDPMRGVLTARPDLMRSLQRLAEHIQKT